MQIALQRTILSEIIIALNTQNYLFSRMRKSRPRSSLGSSIPSANYCHQPPPQKQYRLNEQDIYNSVRNSVYETFKVHTSRTYDIIKEMTGDRVPDKNKQIDKICRKFSILKNTHANKSFEGASIDIEAITKHYIRSRSKDKQREVERKRLKAQIATNYRYGPNQEYRKSEEFFSFQGNGLNNLEKKGFQASRKQKAQSKKNKKHPYLELYEDAQSEAITNLLEKKDLTLFNEKECPELPELQDWQKNTIAVQKLVNNKKEKPPQPRKRMIQSARPRLQKKPEVLYLS